MNTVRPRLLLPLALGALLAATAACRAAGGKDGHGKRSGHASGRTEPESPPVEAMTMSLKSGIQGDLASWRGLSTSETLETASDALRPWTAIHPPEKRERNKLLYEVFVVERPAAPRRVEVWRPDGEQHICLIEYDEPPVDDIERTLRAHGPPELLWSNRRFAEGAVVREHIHASRGITLSIAEPFAASAAPRRAVHVQLYPPTSVERYVSEIGVGAELRPYPR